MCVFVCMCCVCLQTQNYNGNTCADVCVVLCVYYNGDHNVNLCVYLYVFVGV